MILMTSVRAARHGGDVPTGTLVGPTVAFVVAVLALVVWSAAFRYRVPRT